MKYEEIIAKFPLYKRIDDKNIFSSSNEITYDHSFDEARILFFRICRKIPSTFYNEMKMDDFSKALDFFKEKGFEILLSSTNISSEETNHVYLINDSMEMLVKLNYTFYGVNKDIFNPVVENIFSSMSFPDEEEYPMGEEDGENPIYVYMSYKPSQENYDFITKYKSLLTVETTKKNYIYMFEKEANGKFKLSPHKIDGFGIDVDKHYNDDFKDIDAKIKTWCGDFKTINKRLVMLEGVAGTGKTNYIKHLLSVNPEIRKIYIPPYYIEAIADPGFFGFIKKYKNSVLILEDSEKVLVSRDIDAGNSGISVLLNLTDGILASVLNFKIICTFNTNDKEIDSALKRKGRLFTRYHFGKLSEDKTQALYHDLYGRNPVEKSMSLGDIYNEDSNGEIKKEERHMGFGQ